MASIWVIEQGEYSDYRAVGVFSSEANARLVADAINGRPEAPHDAATVAEWPLDPAVDALNQGLRPYWVLMLRDGTVERITQEEVDGYDLAGRVYLWRRTQAPAYQGRGIPDVLQATVWATDETHAIKVANEHRARLIASGEWA